MKKHMSVLMLIARSTVYRVLGVLVLMTGLEVFLFSRAIETLRSGEIIGLEYAFSKALTIWLFLAAFIAVYIILMGSMKNKKSSPKYTLLRLSISEKQFFLWNALYNTACFALLMLIQISVVIGLCHYYMKSGVDASASVQTVFLAFYRSDFLHSLVPFDKPANIIANILLPVIMGLVCARHTVTELWSKGTFWLTYWAIYFGLRGFLRPVDDDIYSVYLWIFLIFGVADVAVYLWKKEAGHEE